MRNLSGWRASVLDLYGSRCVVAGGCDGPTEAHHLVYRSRGGPDVPENGIPVCRLHHAEIHAARLLIDPGWLAPAAIVWLGEVGAVRWDPDGEPAGRHWRSFQRMR